MSTGGLMIELDEHLPTVIEVEGRRIELYLHVRENGNKRCRIIADRDIKITGPHRIKKQALGTPTPMASTGD